MRKRKLNGEFLASISQISGNDLNISGTDFASAMTRFASEYLCGALEIETVGESDGIISVSPSLAAHVIKSMLSYAAPDELLKVKITLGDNMTMETFFENLPAAENLAKIINFAKACGFSVERSKSSITLIADLKHSAVLKIYAVSSSDFKTELKNIFNL